MTVEHKSLHGVELKVLDDDKGVVEAIVSVTGIKDQVNDVIEPGAYTKTLKDRKPKMVWSHDWDKPIGVTESIEELMPGDPRLPAHIKAAGGGALVAKARFIMGTQLGREAYEVVKAFGDDAEFSIGYNVPAGAATMKNGVRHIKSLDLFEYSPVLFGAMAHAKTISLKTALQQEVQAFDELEDLEEKAADGKDKHPFADRDRDGKCDICGVSKEKHGNALAPASDEEKALLSLIVTEEACVDCGGAERLEGKGVGEKPSCLECGGLMVEYALGEEDLAAMSDAEIKALGAQVRGEHELGLDDDDLGLAEAFGVAPEAEVISADELDGLKELGIELDLKGSRRSLDRSPRSNWVEESGDLPGYVREIARALERERGMTLSRAIATAISRIKVWAAGGGDVDADTRAKAVAALAQWEALKAKNAARRAKADAKTLQEFTLSFVDDGADDLSAVAEAAVEAVETKAGRVLSTNNAAKLKRALEDLVHVLRAAGALETQQPQQPTEESQPKAEAEEELVPAGGPPKPDTKTPEAGAEEKSRASAWVTQAAATPAVEGDTDVLTPEELAELRALRAAL